MDLPWRLQFDATARYVDRVSQLGVNSYLSLDARLAWMATRNLELSIVGQNLLDDRHPEFTPTIIPTQATEVQRGIYGKITWHF
jgi:iron complex outermembrane receptor protein